MSRKSEESKGKQLLLIERAAAGDAGAFDKLIEELKPSLAKFCFRLVCNPDDVEDILTEALSRIHRKLGTFRGEAEFDTWAKEITKNCALDHLKCQKRRIQFELPLEAGLPTEVPRILDRLALDQALSCLDPMQRVLLELEVQGLTNQEIANVLGISDTRVSQRKKLLWASIYANNPKLHKECSLAFRRECDSCNLAREEAERKKKRNLRNMLRKVRGRGDGH